MARNKWKGKCSKQRLGFTYTMGRKEAVSARCIRCKLMKPISDFKTYRDNYEGFARYCKDCKVEIKAAIKALKRATIIKKLGGKCCLCNAMNCLQIHHIVPKRMHGYAMIQPDFTSNTLKEVVCLCYDCHLHKAHEGSFNKGGKILDLPPSVPRVVWDE